MGMEMSILTEGLEGVFARAFLNNSLDIVGLLRKCIIVIKSNERLGDLKANVVN